MPGLSLLASLVALSAIGFFAQGCANAPSGAGESTLQRTLTETLANPLFWRIDGRDGGVAYLLGSVHMGPSGGWKYADVVENAFAESGSIVVEVDPAATPPSRIRSILNEQGRLPMGQTLGTTLSSDVHTLLQTRLLELGLDAADFEQVKPWMIGIMLSDFEFRRLGYARENGVEHRLLARSRANKAVIGLETVEFQLSMLDRLSAPNQELMLKEVLFRGEELDSYLRELLQAWQRGDSSRLHELVFEELDTHPELAPFYESIFFDRNRSMANAITGLLDPDEIHFVVVGTGHVVGQRGVASMLAAEGHRVKLLQGF